MAFEIKRGDKIKSRTFSGLKKFGSIYPEAKLYLLYGGNKKMYFDKINVLPIDYALLNLNKIID